MPQSSTVSIKAIVSDVKTLSLGIDQSIPYAVGTDRVLANGTSNGQANQQFTRRYTIAASGTPSIVVLASLE